MESDKFRPPPHCCFTQRRVSLVFLFRVSEGEKHRRARWVCCLVVSQIGTDLFLKSQPARKSRKEEEDKSPDFTLSVSHSMKVDLNNHASRWAMASVNIASQ